ncbi:MAG: hypothetical protein ACLQBA_25745 [Candidatus Binataceae bacterium]
MNAGASEFAALTLGALRTATARALLRDEQGVEDFMGQLAFILKREELLTACLALSTTEQRAVLSAIDTALGTIPLECGCGLPRL